MYDGSRCWERTRTPTSGSVRRISAAATRPSSTLRGGILTSTIATSGLYERTLSSRSSASTARPTTRWPASSSSDAIPSRRSALSSATTTRSCAASGAPGCGGVASLAVMAEVGRGEGIIPDRVDLQRVEHAVALLLAEHEEPLEAYGAFLEAIGSSLGWELGAVWEAGPEDGRLRCARTWHAGDGAPEFEAISERLLLAPGEGLPGRVAASGEPAWMTDVPDAANFPRAEAAPRGGLTAAFAFPLRSPRGVVGVMEFFSRTERELDEGLLRTMATLGSQLGQFVARRHAEGDVKASESRLRAMLEAALDAVVSMDSSGRVIGWNQAAAATFGYHANEVLGRDMAGLIVPPRLRQQHRQGIARILEGGRPAILDRRMELTGMRRDGTEFPVELAITRIALPGPPTFTGYIRDITDRATAQQALLASRASLVEVADEERKRIQRNLHDGAQQRLTAVLLTLGRLRDAPELRTELLDSAIEELATGLQEIRELASGLHPSVL